MSKSLKGIFKFNNPQKYQGKTAPMWRSSWELTFMRMCDEHPNIIAWASEPLRIPYTHPLTGKTTIYIPDFVVEYIDGANRRHVEMIEIKPSTQTYVTEAKSKKDKEALVVNMSKWQAAQKFCAKHGIKFRVLTEKEIYHNYKKKK